MKFAARFRFSPGTKNNPVLIGEPGVGKTAIVEGLAQRIIAGDVPQSQRPQADRLGYGPDCWCQVPGGEERLKAVLKEVTDSGGNLFSS